MTVAYVTMPGTSGNYVSTADVNLLDADTAHGHQSVGLWVSNNNMGTIQSVTAPVTLPALTGAGFTMCHRGSATAATAFCQARLSAARSVTPAEVYTTTVYALSPNADRTFSIRHDYDSGVDGFSSELALTANVWAQHSLTHTVPAGATTLNPHMRFTAGSAFGAGEYVYWFACTHRSGSTEGVVPSLRIVGDLDMRAKAAATDWTAAANQTLLHKAASNNGYSLQITTGGELLGWHGDGSDYNPGTSSGAALTDGEMTELRATMDISAGDWTYYKNGVAFDTDDLAAFTPVIDTTTAGLVGAATATTLLFAGDVEYVEWCDGIGGPVVRRMDAADAYAAHGAELVNNDTWVGSVDGATWTVTADTTWIVTPGDEPSSGRLLVLGLL